MSKPAATYELECGCICYCDNERIFQMCFSCVAQFREYHARAIKYYREHHPLEDIEL